MHGLLDLSFLADILFLLYALRTWVSSSVPFTESLCIGRMAEAYISSIADEMIIDYTYYLHT